MQCLLWLDQELQACACACFLQIMCSQEAVISKDPIFDSSACLWLCSTACKNNLYFPQPYDACPRLCKAACKNIVSLHLSPLTCAACEVCRGGPKFFWPIFADSAQQSCANEVSPYWPGSRAHLRALEALGFFITKYAFSPLWGTFLYYFWNNKVLIFLDKLSWQTFLYTGIQILD